MWTFEVGEVARISEQLLSAKIKSETYYQPESTTVTVCILELRSGFYVVGKWVSPSPASFDLATGKELARQDAINRMWELEGYAQKEASWTRRQMARELIDAED